ncbi:MAG: hypothetical protein MJ198_04315 [Bacteroidales bacterium]|nr:hypothetical protein [Bacteroidales bacterium]
MKKLVSLYVAIIVVCSQTAAQSSIVASGGNVSSLDGATAGISYGHYSWRQLANADRCRVDRIEKSMRMDMEIKKWCEWLRSEGFQWQFHIPSCCGLS